MGHTPADVATLGGKAGEKPSHQPGTPTGISSWWTRIHRITKDISGEHDLWNYWRELFLNESSSSTAVPKKPTKDILRVATLWSVFNILHSDIHTKFPDPWLEPRGENMPEGLADPNAKIQSTRHLAQYMSDIARVEMENIHIREEVKQALQEAFCIPYAGVVIRVDETFISAEAEPEPEKMETDDDGELLVPLGNEKGETAVEMDMISDGQDVTIEFVRSTDILVDPACKDYHHLKGAKWAAIAYYRTVKDLIRSHPEKEAQIKKYLEDSIKKESGKSAESDPAFKTLRCWEVFDNANRRVVRLLDGSGLELEDVDWEIKYCLDTRDHPFPIELIAFNQVRGKEKFPFAISDVQMVEPLVVSINEIVGKINAQVRRLRRKIGVKQGTLTKGNAQKLMSDIDMELIEFRLDDDLMGRIQSLKQIFEVIGAPGLESDLLIILEAMRAVLKEIIGYSSADRGGVPKSRSATEAIQVGERLAARISERSAMVNDFYVRILKTLIAVWRQVYSEERVAKIGIDFPSEMWTSWSGKLFDIDLIVSVVVGTSAPKDRQTVINTELNIFTQLAPHMERIGLNVQPLIRRLFERLEIKDIEEIFNNQKQLAMMLLKMLLATKEGEDIEPDQFMLMVTQLVDSILTEVDKAQLQGKGGQGEGQKQMRGANTSAPSGSGLDTGQAGAL